MLKKVKKEFDDFTRHGLYLVEMHELVEFASDVITSVIARHGYPGVIMNTDFNVGGHQYELTIDAEIREVKGDAKHE